MQSLTASPHSVLVAPERHPLRPSEFVMKLGRVIVVAPHPDDESLGCGGLLALLAAAGRVAQVFFMTDGSRSHSRSLSHPAARLAALREEEAVAALSELGLPPGSAHFLRFGDGAMPKEGTSPFVEATRRLQQMVTAIRPDTLLVPWRRDPHCDHEATWRLFTAVVAGLRPAPRWLEYPVWAWTKAEGESAPRAEEAIAWRLDISAVLLRKQRGIGRHRSQLGAIIHDDPTGFVLPPEMLSHFGWPWELYLEPRDV